MAVNNRQSTLARMAEAIATPEAQWSFAERLEAPEDADEWEHRDVLGYVRQELDGNGGSTE